MGRRMWLAKVPLKCMTAPYLLPHKKLRPLYKNGNKREMKDDDKDAWSEFRSW